MLYRHWHTRDHRHQGLGSYDRPCEVTGKVSCKVIGNWRGVRFLVGETLPNTALEQEVQEGAAPPAHGNQRSGREAQPEWIA